MELFSHRQCRYGRVAVGIDCSHRIVMRTETERT